MASNIKYNNTRALALYILRDEYWDHMLFKGEVYGNYNGLTTDCLSSYIDMNDKVCIGDDGYLYSSRSWDKAINSGVTFKNIGWTGVDNGFIHYDKWEITPNEFWKLYTQSEYTIDSGDTRFFIYPVTGNTGLYTYESGINSESGKTYLSLKGGFYQGFFKMYGYDYQTLPSIIEDEWNFEFVLRGRSDYETEDTIINNKHPENKGIFFYIGARAENKFAEIYNGVYDNKKSFESDECNPITHNYMDRNLADYFVDGNEMREYINDAGCEGEQIDLSKVSLSADGGSYVEFDTDNKFLFFNRTCTGFTTHTWEQGDLVHFQMEMRDYIDNPFMLYNRTCTGYTVRDYEKITYPSGSVWSSANTYNMTKDILGQAFALKYNDDGSISYRYTIKDCDAESGYTTLEETTLSGLVKDGEWEVINIKFKVLEGYVDECGNPHPSTRKMKMYIYLNGYLIFISKEMPAFNFKQLNDTYDKQEGVPFNISLGGGSQGLMERIWPNYFNIPTEVYEIEKNYAGTFIGDIMSFKFYTCGMNIQQIRENYKYELTNIK